MHAHNAPLIANFLLAIKYILLSNPKIPANIKNVAAVPTAGIVTKVGKKVPMILPIVLSAPSRPTVDALLSKSWVVYLTKHGVTVPNSISGNIKITTHDINDAQTRKFLVIIMAIPNDIPVMIYLPKKGINATEHYCTSISIYWKNTKTTLY